MKPFKVRYYSKVHGIIEEVEVLAESEAEILRNTLANPDIIVLDIKPKWEFLASLFEFGKVPLKELADFCYTVGKSLEIGVDVISTLQDLVSVSKSAKMRNALRRIVYDLQGGASLSEAVSRQKKVFPPDLVALIKVGETSGNLPSILLRYSEHLDWLLKMRAEIKKAMAYPIMASSAIVLIIIVLTTFVLPRIVQAIKLLGLKQLPLPTKVIIFMSKHGILIVHLIALIAISITISAILRRIIPKFRYYYDKFILKVPVIGDFILQKHLIEDLRSLADIYSSGGSLLLALDLIRRDLETNEFLKEVFSDIKDRVERGTSLSLAFRESGVFPPLVVRTIQIGEETGTLDESTSRTVELYETNIRKAVEALSTFIEPVLQLLLGIFLGTVAAGILMPVYNIITQLGRFR
jgi:type IV pilus assembly protein PilC